MPPALTRLSADGSLVSALEVFDTDGGMVVEGMVDGGVIDELLRATTAFAKGIQPGVANQGMGEAGMPFSQQVTPVRQPGTYQFTVSNPGGRPWAIGVASEDAIYSIPGDNLPQGFCPPGCPPLPSGFDGPPANIGEKSSYD